MNNKNVIYDFSFMILMDLQQKNADMEFSEKLTALKKAKLILKSSLFSLITVTFQKSFFGWKLYGKIEAN